MTSRFLSMSITGVVALLATTPAFASENGQTRGGSIVGLDGISFFDIPPAGLYVLNYSGVSDSRRFADNSGKDALPGANASIAYNVARISLFTKTKLLGADLAAFEVFPTFVRTKIRVTDRTFTSSGLTDLAVDPFGLAWTSPKQNIGFSTTVVLPTASYNQNKPINIGTNRVTWMPQFFYTRFFGNRSSDVSVHLMYERAFANKKGLVSQINPTGAKYASGDIIHGAFAYQHSVAKNLSLGISGIAAVQIEDDRIVGDDAGNAILRGPLDGYRYKRGTLGLSTRYLLGGRLPVTFTYQRDLYARNTTKTNVYMMRIVAPLKMF